MEMLRNTWYDAIFHVFLILSTYDFREAEQCRNVQGPSTFIVANGIRIHACFKNASHFFYFVLFHGDEKFGSQCGRVDYRSWI